MTPKQDNQDKKDNNQHDTGYKLLFSHPELVKDLLTGRLYKRGLGLGD